MPLYLRSSPKNKEILLYNQVKYNHQIQDTEYDAVLLSKPQSITEFPNGPPSPFQ